MIAVEVYRDVAAVERHRDEWRALFDASRAEPSASYEWIHAMCQAHLRSRDQFFLIVLRREGRLCGLVPLVASEERLAGLPLVTLVPLSERYRTHSDMLVHPVDDEVVAALVGAILALPRQWDLFRLIQVLDTNPLLGALDRGLQRLGARCRLRAEPPSFFLPLPPTFDDYLAARTSKFRNHLRRVEKKLAATGTVRVISTGVDLDLERSIAALLDIEAKSWKHAHGTAISSVAHQTTFYRELVGGLMERGRLHLQFLTRDDEPIAYNLGLVCRGQYAYLKTSFIEALKPLGPATILRARLVAGLIADGVEALDFPAEPYEWEAQWTSEHRAHHSIVAWNRTLRARAWALAWRLREARKPAGQSGIAYANARDLKVPADDE
jgi:CelD/BcsL family acetyltransferase involved in cellulose biosynthesis